MTFKLNRINALATQDGLEGTARRRLSLVLQSLVCTVNAEILLKDSSANVQLATVESIVNFKPMIADQTLAPIQENARHREIKCNASVQQDSKELDVK